MTVCGRVGGDGDPMGVIGSGSGCAGGRSSVRVNDGNYCFVQVRVAHRGRSCT
jgi:hypothetical protein